MNRSPWRLEEVDGSPWRLEEVDGGDEQYPVESRFAVRHTPPDEQDPRFDRRRSVSSVLRYATPLLINRTPVLTVGGPFPPFCGTPHPSRSTGPRFDRRRSVSSVLRYARPLPMNRIPFRTWPVEHNAVSSVLRYARPRFHRMFRPSPPDEHDAFCCLPMNTTTMLFLRSDPAMYTSLGRTYARVGI